MFRFSFTDSFRKNLAALDQRFQKQIKEKLEWLSNQENPLLFAKKLKGHKNLFRFRSGNFRVVFEVSETIVILLLVKDRRDVYEGL